MHRSTNNYLSNPRVWLGAILCLGLALRVWGIAWGLPDRTDLHPDEHDYVMRHALWPARAWAWPPAANTRRPWRSSRSSPGRWTGRIVVAATLLYTGLFTTQTAARFSAETRVVAGHWLDAHLRHGGNLLALGWDRYLAVPTRRNDVHVRSAAQEGALRHLGDDDANDLIEITSLHYRRHFRHGNEVWKIAYRRLRNPQGAFQQVAKFESHFINKRLYMKLDPMFEGYFISPTLEFYRSKHLHALHAAAAHVRG